MARTKKTAEPLPTIWHVDDVPWAEAEKVLEEHDPPARFGPARIDQRGAWDGVIYRMRSGVQWNRLPKEYGDDSSIHRTFQRWVKRGVIGPGAPGCWSRVARSWPGWSGSGRASTVRWGRPGTGDQVGANPTDRAKNGTQRGVLTEADGGPIAVVVKGANVHDSLLLQDALEKVVVEPPDPVEVRDNPDPLTQHLCLDMAFSDEHSDATARVSGYEPNCRQIGQEKQDAKTGDKKHPARRWVVERTIGWLNRCRGILIRYEKKAQNYLTVVPLACALLWYRRLHRLAT